MNTMKRHNSRTDSNGLFLSKFVVGFVAVACAVTVCAFGQNKVVFDNQSGEPALVKLIGPTKAEVDVANGAKAGTEATAGRYFIKVRYGEPGKYHYSKGDEFEVTETATANSETTITLHKVVTGNYDARPISAEDFGAASTASSQEKRIVIVDKDALKPARCEIQCGLAVLRNITNKLDNWVGIKPSGFSDAETKRRMEESYSKSGTPVQFDVTEGGYFVPAAGSFPLLVSQRVTGEYVSAIDGGHPKDCTPRIIVGALWQPAATDGKTNVLPGPVIRPYAEDLSDLGKGEMCYSLTDDKHNIAAMWTVYTNGGTAKALFCLPDKDTDFTLLLVGQKPIRFQRK